MSKWTREGQVITNVFKAHRVRAKVVKVFETPAFILYGVVKSPEEKISNVERLMDEVALAVSEVRRRAVKVRFQHPPIMIEVPHPSPKAIPWPQKATCGAHQAVAGRGYEWGRAVDQVIDFDSSPHTLVAGITGSGKSVLAQGLALSMAHVTSPAQCRYMLIDLKREDFVPLRKLPHTVEFAGDPDQAMRVIEMVAGESARRRDSSDRPDYRLVLWIDELAQLPAEGLEMLNRILALGRSQRINIISCTQHPTAEVMGGSVGKINYTTRLTGRVADATAANTASGRAKTGAEMLPGRGSFIRVEGPDLTRFQAYMVTPKQVRQLVAGERQRWSGVAPAQGSQTVRTHVVSSTSTLAAVFEQYYDGNGGLLRGGLMAAKRALFGDRASNGGRAGQEQRAEVMARLGEWIASRNTSGDASGKRPEMRPGITSPLVVGQINGSQKNGTHSTNGVWF